MDAVQALTVARELVVSCGYDPDNIQCPNFLEYAERVARIVAEGLQSGKIRNTAGRKEWASAWGRLYREFRDKYQADPGMLYRPMNHASAAFHRSLAFIRYFRGGNRTSKTQSGYMEDYLIATGQHPWRDFPPPPHAVFIISGLPFTIYHEKVFEKKFITGEPGNPLSPLFPEGGAWLHRYDRAQKIIYIACPKCKEAGTPRECPHPKSSITLFSAENGPKVVEAFKGTAAHIDEHVEESFLDATKQRLADTPGSCMYVTGTPLNGPEAWEKLRLADVASGPPEQNRSDPENPDSPPLVEMFEISQWDAGVVPHEVIRRNMQDMDEFEIAARIMGKPAPLAKNPVFDRARLAEMRQECTQPRFGSLAMKVDIIELCESHELEFVPTVVGRSQQQEWIGWRIWEEPKRGYTYVATADVAAGLTGRDASACTIFKVWEAKNKRYAEQVAQFYGWIDMDDYADEIKKACVWYHNAVAVPEITGIGRAVVLRLRKQLFYWNIFRGEAKPELVTVGIDSRLGVDTNTATKPPMVSAAATAVRNGSMILRCEHTIWEMSGFEQERSDSGKTTIYRGANGSRDDRTMSVVFGAYVCFTHAGFENLANLSEDMHNNEEEEVSPEDRIWLAKHQEMLKNSQPDPFRSY